MNGTRDLTAEYPSMLAPKSNARKDRRSWHRLAGVEACATTASALPLTTNAAIMPRFWFGAKHSCDKCRLQGYGNTGVDRCAG